MQTDFEFVASVKKFSTQASKGGSIVLSLEMDLTEEEALLAFKQNGNCAVKLTFSKEAMEITNQKKAKKEQEKIGQGDLEFGVNNE